jgi:hypothetical protein
MVASDFRVPVLLETDRVRIRPLVVEDTTKDFEAVVSSEDHLRTSFRPGGEWPHRLTLEKNASDLKWHEEEFGNRTSFAYTVVSLDESEVQGCVYIYPCTKLEYDAQIWLWVRQSRLVEGLDEHLFASVTTWIETSWPFENPVYPGRSVSHDKWRALESRARE